jgi:3-oxoacyl-[acyl-carrier protein] reductase
MAGLSARKEIGSATGRFAGRSAAATAGFHEGVLFKQLISYGRVRLPATPQPLSFEQGVIAMRVQDKSIIVTGSGGGIGEGIARRLAAEGANVIVNDINAAMGEKVVAQIKAAGGIASFFAADVTKSADVKALVQAAVTRHGKLDVMVNNAGWTHRNRPALEVSEEEFDKCFAVNMKSIYLSTIHAVPALRANKGGSFINIASTAGVRPRPGLTWYNGSKGAVITTSKSLAAELGPDNIRVNCINPVFNPDTGLSAQFAGGPVDEARRAKFLATIPLGRFSTALDVANAALYLASDEAAFISGVCIEVDGARCV